LVFWAPFQWSLLLWLIAAYSIRMFAITAGFHRYFSHRAYKMGRVPQFLLAFLAQTSAQKGVLWWAAHHRLHHRHADTEHDAHSPVVKGLWWSHIGWLFSGASNDYDEGVIQDFEKYPELRILNKYHTVPAILFGAGLYAVGGFAVFVWGFVVSTVLLYHCTFSINSLAHVWGSRRYETKDHSRNNLLLALITFGEGWHNNHHQFMYSARQGLRWWEIDVTYYILRTLSVVGIVRDLRQVNRSDINLTRTVSRVQPLP
jgi:stearoyl-CoA desaturase (Delta-9 desaturase)